MAKRKPVAVPAPAVVPVSYCVFDVYQAQKRTIVAVPFRANEYAVALHAIESCRQKLIEELGPEHMRGNRPGFIGFYDEAVIYEK